MRDANPVVILMPSVGMFTFAKDKPTARIAAEFYGNAIRVMRGASAVDEYLGLPEQEAFDIEYWALEEAKLRRQPAPKPLAGRVALITGGAGGIGRAIAERLLADDACVVLLDNDTDALARTADELAPKFGKDRTRVIAMRRYRRSERRSRLRLHRARIRRRRHRSIECGNRICRALRSNHNRNLAPQHGRARHRLLPCRPRSGADSESAGHRRLDRIHRQQECAGRIFRRRRLQHGEGRRASPRAMHGAGPRGRRNSSQRRESRRRAARLANLVEQLAGRTRACVRDRSVGAGRILSENGACSNKTSRPRTSPRQCTFLRPIDRQSPPATSSTSTPATPLHSRAKAKRGFYDATHANRSRLGRETQRAPAEGPCRRLRAPRNRAGAAWSRSRSDHCAHTALCRGDSELGRRFGRYAVRAFPDRR